jgi:hypothetical protein
MKKLSFIFLSCSVFVGVSSLGQTFPVKYLGSDPQTTAVLTYYFCTTTPNKPCDDKSILTTTASVPLKNGANESVTGPDTANTLLIGQHVDIYITPNKTPIASEDFSQSQCSSSSSSTLNVTSSGSGSNTDIQCSAGN